MRLTIYWTKEAMHKPSDGSPRMYDRIVNASDSLIISASMVKHPLMLRRLTFRI